MAQELEAKAFADQVASGALPPLAERLPVNPLVITPLERPAAYGGTWNNALVGGGGSHVIVRCQGYEPLVRFNQDWTGLVENTAEHFEANADATEFTFRLRKGHKWSDGAPFTTADVQFWYDACFADPESTTGGNSWWYVNGEPGTIEVVDEQVFKVKFPARTAFSPTSSPGLSRTRSPARPSTTSRSSTSATIRTPTSWPRMPASRAGSRCSSVRWALPTTRCSTRTRTGRPSTPGRSPMRAAPRRARTPSRRSPSAIPIISRSIPRANSCPTWIASSISWWPIRRCCC